MGRQPHAVHKQSGSQPVPQARVPPRLVLDLSRKTPDLTFFAVFAVYVWAGIDPRLLFQWQAPVFSTMPGFIDEFLKSPGGVVDYVSRLLGQANAWRTLGTIVITAQAAVATVLAEGSVSFLAGRSVPLVRFGPALFLMYRLNVYHDRTPVALYLILGLLPLWLVGLVFRRHTRRPDIRMHWVLATALPLLALGSLAVWSYRHNTLERQVGKLDYSGSTGDWPKLIEVSVGLPKEAFNPLTVYQVNLALHEMNRLGDDMFRFPQPGPMLLEFQARMSLPHLLKLTEMCLRLGRLNEAEHFGSETLVIAKTDPPIYRLLARINMVKGETAAARKFLTHLSYDLVNGAWARERLRELDRDPQLASSPEVQTLRRRRLQKDDMLPVWQRADRVGPDLERLLLDQLEQDPSNRMAFEFLAGSYLLTRNLAALHALMPRIKDMTGPAYAEAGGRRRTPRHYQEAMAIYSDSIGTPMNIDGFEVQAETIQRAAAFKAILSQFRTRDTAMQAAWTGFRDTYFFYFTFGPGDYR